MLLIKPGEVNQMFCEHEVLNPNNLCSALGGSAALEEFDTLQERPSWSKKKGRG